MSTVISFAAVVWQRERSWALFRSLLPASGEKGRMCVILNQRDCSSIEITLTPSLSRHTRRGGQGVT